MLKLFLLSFIFTLSLFANKVIYLSYDTVPERVVKGEIFKVKIKALSTVRDFEDIRYNFNNRRGVIQLNSEPERSVKGKYFYDTFYFQCKSSRARLPDFTAKLVTENETAYPTTTLSGEDLHVITLNPKKDFSHVIADNFLLQEFKTTSFDNKHNIIIFVAVAKNTSLKDIHFENVYKQGIESLKDSHYKAKVTYFVVVDKKLENFSFSYFNLKKNRFENINIPIVVNDDSVVAQSDLKPKDQSKVTLKITIVSVAVLFILLFILWRKKYIYLLLLIFPVAYIAYLAIPEQDICVKSGSDIHLLPVNNGTIFETTAQQSLFPKEGSVTNFVKVKLKNEKIGWVKNEDICSY